MVDITKTNDLDGEPLRPGDSFEYNFSVRCSSLTVDCINQTLVDVLPAGLEVVDLPDSTSTRIVTYVAETRELRIEFRVPTQEPEGEFGLRAGTTVNLDVGMRLPTETPITTGTVVSNTGSTVADNAPEKNSTNELTVDVPRRVQPVTTKAWADGSAVAGSAETSTITLGVRNASSSSAQVTALTVTDDTPATFEHFDFDRAAVESYPAGATTAQLLVCTRPNSACADADYAGGPPTTAAALALPAGVSASEVTAIRVRFRNAAGEVLPYDAEGGAVEARMVLRDTVRSTGAPLSPTDKLTVENCASTTAVDQVAGPVIGAPACRSYDILPSTLTMNATKAFFADSDGNWTNNPGEYAVLGETSPVSITVDVRNNSAFGIAEVTLTEPGSASTTEFDRFDALKLRLRLPRGAQTARLVVRYADGTSTTTSYTADTSVPIRRPGTRVTSVSVTYRGVTDGRPTIAAGAIAGLDLHGALNNRVTADDLPGGRSPGVANCADFQASAGRVDGSGTADGSACATLPVRDRITTSTGTKAVGQASVPLGQPIPFALTVTNNGTLPLIDPVISDPATNAAGVPDPGRPNPFSTLQITRASITKSANTPGVQIELYDPAAADWVPYDDGSDAALLTRATGVRARMIGDLAPTRSFTLNLETVRRPTSPDGVSVSNCFSVAAGGEFVPTNPTCGSTIVTGPVNAGAVLNKSISPSVLPRRVAGAPQQFAEVALTLRNTGNLNISRLQATDNDEDFFAAVDFVDFRPVQFPAGADRVQIDAFVAGAWVQGTPRNSAALPAGVTPGQVTGIRATFTSSDPGNDGYQIRPCPAGTRSCEGRVAFRVSPRLTLRNEPTTAVPEVFFDTATGSYATRLDGPGGSRPIPPVEATLSLVAGSSQLNVSKAPNSSIGPGQTAPFTLTVTNSGTGNIPQLLVSDAMPVGLEFYDAFAGDGGQPFRIVNASVPSGTEPVPAPTFTVVNDGERVSGLRWDFGDWLFRPGATFQIQFEVRLEPGVIVGQTMTNLMGATSPVEGLGCAPGDPVSDDGTLGPGRFCSATAEVTARAGAAFSARKWVAGRDELGWYNTRTRARVAVGAAGCASTTDSEGRRYTAYPCIALINPGDTFDYLLRLTNAGTEAAREMRIIDRLPVAGDRGVIVDQARLTAWDSRPRMAGEPVLDGTTPGVLSARYTDSADLCVRDLDMGPDPCPAGAWDDPLSVDTAGVQLRLAFPTRLAPGGRVAIKFSMTAPVEVERADDPTIAWNSYAHVETTVRANGRDHILPPTEPLKVGIGLSYGTLAITKAIGANPANLPLDDLQFEFRYRCTIAPVGGDVQEVAAGNVNAAPTGPPALVSGLPAGATCAVWEVEDYGGQSSATEASPAIVTIAPFVPGDAEPLSPVTVTNDFPNSVLEIRKLVIGPAAAFGPDRYPVEVRCTFAGVPVPGFDPLRLEVIVGAPAFAVEVPAGSACTVREITSAGAAVSYDPAADNGELGSAPVTVTPTGTAEVVITNDFRAGSLVITKDLTGPGAPRLAGGPFRFAVECAFDGRQVFGETITLTPDGRQSTVSSEPITPLPVGAVCTITETDAGGADTVPPPVTVTIPAEVAGQPQTVVAGVANAFSAGTLRVRKELAGAGADADYATRAIFTVQVTCQRRNADGDITTVLSRAVRVRGGQTVTLRSADDEPLLLPLGSRCFGAETSTGGATATRLNFDSFDNAAVVVASDQVQILQIEAVNTFEVGSLRLTKTVTGPGAGFAAGRRYELAVTCVLPQGDVLTPVLTKRPVRLRAAESAVLDGIPVGARCWAAETGRGGATRTTLSAGSLATAVTIGAGRPVTIGATNTFAVGVLEVRKRVIGGDRGPYRFSLRCRTSLRAIQLPAQDGLFALSDGQARRIRVPQGARCTVRELRPPARATVRYAGSDGRRDGVIAVTGDASVVVTNRFSAAPDPPGPPAPPVPDRPIGPGQHIPGGTAPRSGLLPGTGGPAAVIVLLGLLATGAGAALLGRRRRS